MKSVGRFFNIHSKAIGTMDARTQIFADVLQGLYISKQEVHFYE